MSMCIWAVQRTWYSAAPHYGKTSPSNFLVSCNPAAGPSVMPDPQTKPAPWQLTGQCYLLFKYTTGVHAQRRPSEGCPSHQSIIDFDPVSPFVGGVGGILFVRYDTSPVGPYSELLFVPGAYATQPLSPLRGHSSSAFRVSQIFVSSSASVMSGRENWGVPKQKADFTWQHGPQRGVVQLSVRLPQASAPFFWIHVQTWGPFSLPFSTRFLPERFTTIVQRPLLEAVLPPHSDKADHPMPATKAGLTFSHSSPRYNLASCLPAQAACIRCTY